MSVWIDPLPGWFRRRTSTTTDGIEKSGSETASTTTGGGSEGEPVVVWEAANSMEAYVVKGRLESEGIPAIIRGEALGVIYGLTAGNLAAAKVLVPALLAEKALDVLLMDGASFEDAEEEGGVENSGDVSGNYSES